MDVQRLAKVLAMAASDNEAEALHALRTAGRLLDNAGLDFVALADRLGESGPLVPPTRLEDLEDTVFDLRNEIRHLRSENERLRQGGPTAPNAAAAAAPGLAAAAQDAAQVIRLRAELDASERELERVLTGAAEAEMALRDDLAQAIDAAERLTAQFEQLKGRSDRLEAENRRLSLMAAALKVELDERLADRTHPLPPAMAAPPPVASAESLPRRAPLPPAAARRGKVSPANQYALF